MLSFDRRVPDDKATYWIWHIRQIQKQHDVKLYAVPKLEIISDNHQCAFINIKYIAS